ncbi:MAG: VOC family protein [Alphaproteobacteria bacterium]|nr:VOC family protein [Alphaproteobacteria bacterium]
MSLIVNIDVPDVSEAASFYEDAFGFERLRPLFAGKIVEMRHGGVLIHLLTKPAEAPATPAGARRTYARHWTPLHLDIIVDDVAAAFARARAAGAISERPIADHAWGRIAGVADPWGHGFCLIELSDAGYDAAG